MKVLLLALVLASFAVSARADKPAPYTSKVLGFSASYPYPVKESDDPQGGGTAAAFDPQGVMYMVGVAIGTDATKKKSVKDQLDDGMAGMMARVGGKVVTQKDIKLGKNPGREAEIDVQGGHATFRVYLVGGKTYLVGVVHKTDLEPPMAPAAFFDSFHLTETK